MCHQLPDTLNEAQSLIASVEPVDSGASRCSYWAHENFSWESPFPDPVLGLSIWKIAQAEPQGGCGEGVGGAAGSVVRAQTLMALLLTEDWVRVEPRGLISPSAADLQATVRA